MAQEQSQPQQIIINQRPANAQNANQVDFQYLISQCLAKWKWFAVSLAVCLFGMAFHLIRQTPTYSRDAALLIKEDGKGGASLSSELGAAADLGMFSSKSNVQNELVAIQSPAVVLEVVNRLHLDMRYTVKEKLGLRNKVLYGSNLPVTVQLLDLPDNAGVSFKMDVLGDSAVVISKMKFDKESASEDYTGAYNDTIETIAGPVIVTPNLGANPEQLEEISGKTIHVTRTGLVKTVERYKKNLKVALNQKLNTILDISFDDNTIQGAEEFINTLISVYNENWVRDKNQIAVSTSEFINERLSIIEKELGMVDSDISDYKSANQIPDLKAAANMYMNKANQANAQALELNNVLYMARYVRNFVVSDANKFQLLPANSGIGNPTIESQIHNYNEKLLQRNSLVANSSTKNPLVVDLDKNLATMRASIVTSIDNQITSLNQQIASVRGIESQSTARITSNPTQAKYLLSVERQQKVKESLYLFLLQKREENELSQAFTAYNTRVVTPPTGSLEPTAPNKKKFMLIAFLLGLGIPFAAIYFMETLNTKVRGRKDIEKLKAPFIGEIPTLPSLVKEGKRNKKLKKEEYQIVVKHGSRDAINEAFRVVRTNLEFMIGFKEDHKVVMLTSSNPGSGKTFLSMNLATSLALKNKKILAIDLDMRRASLSTYVGNPSKGISNYLSNQIDNVEDLIVKGQVHENIDVLPVGKMPPNPTELLFNPKLEKLIESYKQQYDYVFIDCPPVEIVADASIIAKWVDFTIFVVRAGLFEREMLPTVDKYYEDKKFTNMAVLLNATKMQGKYGNSRYGYHYGYGNKNYYGNS